MCVGALVANEPQLQLLRKKANALKFRQKLGKKDGNSEVRKEKSRDAARCRRAKESDYFQDLEDLLPVSGTPPRSMSGIDKTSLIRLTVSHLKCRDIVAHAGIRIPPEVKEELIGDLHFNVADALDGFSLVLSQEGDVIHVSNNVTNFIGLTSFELLGNAFSEFVHPCDHEQLKKLHPQGAEQDAHVEVFVRMKCTITDRGRMINLKQANYKALKLSGKARRMEEREGGGGVTGVIFLGIGSLVYSQMDSAVVEGNSWAFATKHAADMKFTEVDGWLAEEGNYSVNQLLGKSFFELVHSQDIHSVMPAFKNLKEHGQCETLPYRLLVGGGGSVWVQTKAALVTARRGSNKGNTVCCRHTIITEIENRYEILSLIQTQAVRRGGQSSVAGGSAIKQRRPKMRSISAAGCESSRPVVAADQYKCQSKPQHGPSYSAADMAVAPDTSILPPPAPRFRDMDLLLDMLAMDQQTSIIKDHEQTVLEQDSTTRLETNSTTTTIINQTNGGTVVTAAAAAPPQDTTYSDLLAMSPSDSVEDEEEGDGGNGSGRGGYIAETLAIHLASMPSVALRAARQAARESAAAAAQQQQQQVILQQRPTSVIVASSTFCSTPVTAAEFGIGPAKSLSASERDESTAAMPTTKFSADEAENILSMVSLPTVGVDSKPELYNSHTGMKKVGSMSALTATTANLFNRPKAVTNSLFSFSTSAAATVASATVTAAVYGRDAQSSAGDLLAAAVAPQPAAKPAPAQPTIVALAPRSEPAVVEPCAGRSFGGSSSSSGFLSAKEFSMEEDTLLRELFGDMAENGTELEKLSPYIGDVCVILKEPNNKTDARGGPVPSNSGPPSTATTAPLDIQVIDFGPAGAGFDDDYEIMPIFGDYSKVKSEPGLEVVDLKDFPELLAPLSPSQETPLHQEEEDDLGDYFRKRQRPGLPVRCDEDRGLLPEAAGGLFWNPSQPPLLDPVRKSVISRNPGTAAATASSSSLTMRSPLGPHHQHPHHAADLFGGDCSSSRSSVLRGAPFGCGGQEFLPIVIPTSPPPPAQQAFFYSEEPLYRENGDYNTEVLYNSLLAAGPTPAKRSRPDQQQLPAREVKRFKPSQPPLSMSF